MIYRVHEDEVVFWPDGTVRAKCGQTFDGYDTNGTVSSRQWAQAIIGRQSVKCYVCEEDQCTAPDVDDVPDSVRDALAALAGGDFDAVKSIAPKPKAAKKKATKKATTERLGDPEE